MMENVDAKYEYLMEISMETDVISPQQTPSSHAGIEIRKL